MFLSLSTLQISSAAPDAAAGGPPFFSSPFPLQAPVCMPVCVYRWRYYHKLQVQPAVGLYQGVCSWETKDGWGWPHRCSLIHEGALKQWGGGANTPLTVLESATGSVSASIFYSLCP